MHKEKCIPHSFLTDVVHAMVYLINKYPNVTTSYIICNNTHLLIKLDNWILTQGHYPSWDKLQSKENPTSTTHRGILWFINEKIIRTMYHVVYPLFTLCASLYWTQMSLWFTLGHGSWVYFRFPNSKKEINNKSMIPCSVTISRWCVPPKMK